MIILTIHGNNETEISISHLENYVLAISQVFNVTLGHFHYSLSTRECPNCPNNIKRCIDVVLM